MIKDDNYIMILGWMKTKLGLKNNELEIYAVIHGFSQTENQYYTGGISYLMEWTSSTKKTVITTLSSLVDKGMLARKEVITDGCRRVYYQAIKPEELGVKITPDEVKKLHQGGCKNYTKVVKNLHQGGEKITPTLINNNNNIYNNISFCPSDGKKESKIPSLQEVMDYAKSKAYDGYVDPEEFWNFYEARGWKLQNGKPIEKWKSQMYYWYSNAKKSKKAVGDTYDDGNFDIDKYKRFINDF